MSDFGIVITAMVTPFDNDMRIDFDLAQELADYLINNGSDGLVVAGTTGESPTLSSEEKLELFKAVKDAVGNRASVIGGTGSNSTAASIELTKKAEKTGIDAVMAVVPYYNRPPQSGLYAHFAAIADSTDLPLILYNVPSRTSCNMEAETVIRLSEKKNILALKEACTDEEQIIKVIADTPDDFLVYCGNDDWNLQMLELGANGFISVASHIVGNQIKKMDELFVSGNKEEAVKVHNQLIPIYKALFEITNPILVKAALGIMWKNVGSPRLPLIKATQEQASKLRDIIEEKIGLN